MREAANLERFRKLLADDPEVMIPRVYRDALDAARPHHGAPRGLSDPGHHGARRRPGAEGLGGAQALPPPLAADVRVRRPAHRPASRATTSSRTTRGSASSTSARCASSSPRSAGATCALARGLLAARRRRRSAPPASALGFVDAGRGPRAVRRDAAHHLRADPGRPRRSTRATTTSSSAACAVSQITLVAPALQGARPPGVPPARARRARRLPEGLRHGPQLAPHLPRHRRRRPRRQRSTP